MSKWMKKVKAVEQEEDKHSIAMTDLEWYILWFLAAVKEF